MEEGWIGDEETTEKVEELPFVSKSGKSGLRSPGRYSMPASTNAKTPIENYTAVKPLLKNRAQSTTGSIPGVDKGFRKMEQINAFQPKVYVHEFVTFRENLGGFEFLRIDEAFIEIPEREFKDHPNVRISETSSVDSDAVLMDNARVEDYARVGGTVADNGLVKDYAIVKSSSMIMGSGQLYGNATLEGGGVICDQGSVYGDAYVKFAIIAGCAKVGGRARIEGPSAFLANTFP